MVGGGDKLECIDISAFNIQKQKWWWRRMAYYHGMICVGCLIKTLQNLECKMKIALGYNNSIYGMNSVVFVPKTGPV